MAKYVDGFVLAVPKKNIETYRKLARKSGKRWREHGALEYGERVADDDRRARSRLREERQAQTKRGRVVVVYRLQIAQASRCSQ